MQTCRQPVMCRDFPGKATCLGRGVDLEAFHESYHGKGGAAGSGRKPFPGRRQVDNPNSIGKAMGRHILAGPQEYVSRLFMDSGIEINGAEPWDIQVSNPAFYRRVFLGGSLALGETYMKGWWECEALDQFFCRILRHGIDRNSLKRLSEAALTVAARIINRQKKRRAYVIGKRHYDVGNDLFESMLDPRMIYSCGYWRMRAPGRGPGGQARPGLPQARPRAGDALLDIGCGWGGLARSPPSVRGRGGGHHRLARAGRVGPGALRRSAGGDPPAGLPRARTSPSTAWSRSACSSTSATRTTGPSWRWRAAACATTACSCCTPSARTRPVIIAIPGSTSISFPTAMLPSIKQIGAAHRTLFHHGGLPQLRRRL